RDERVRRLENGASGAVVLLETIEFRVGEVALELLHVLRARATPAIDRLIIVKYRKRAALAAHQQSHPAVLNGIGVLELIHQHVAEAPPVVREQLRLVTPDLKCPQQQLRKIDDASLRAGA